MSFAPHNPIQAAAQINSMAASAESEAVKKLLTFVSVGLLGMMLYREFKEATRQKSWREREHERRAGQSWER